MEQNIHLKTDNNEKAIILLNHHIINIIFV